MDLAYLQRRADPLRVAWAEGAIRPAPAPAAIRIKLNTGFPEFKLPDDVVRRFRESASAAAASRLPAPPTVALPADDRAAHARPPGERGA